MLLSTKPVAALGDLKYEFSQRDHDEHVRSTNRDDQRDAGLNATARASSSAAPRARPEFITPYAITRHQRTRIAFVTCCIRMTIFVEHERRRLAPCNGLPINVTAPIRPEETVASSSAVPNGGCFKLQASAAPAAQRQRMPPKPR